MIRIRDFGEMVRASGILRRIVVPVEKNWHPTDGPRPRGAKAVIDESTAARLSAVVGDGEFAEFAGAAHGAPEDSATTTAALIRRNTPAAAIAVATLACLWVGNRMNHSLPDTVAHAGADSGSFGEPTAAAGPMFGAGRNPSARGGDPAMNLKNSARVAVLAVTAAVTANGALAGDAVQWRVADGGNGHWYQQNAYGELSSWAAANAHCQSLGGYLATLTGAQEQGFVWAAAQAATCEMWGGAMWIGARQQTGMPPDEGWQWVTDEPWEYTNWAPGEPNDFDGWPEDRLGLYVSTGKWVDGVDLVSYACNFSAMIEWSADCNHDGFVDYGQCHDGTLPDYNGNNIPDCCEQGVQCTVGNYPVQWRMEDGGNGHWYQPTTNSFVNFATAKSYAQAQGGHLVTLTTAAENKFAANLSSGEYLLGGFQDITATDYSEPSGGWRWVTGEAWDFTAWNLSTNEPNNGYGSYLGEQYLAWSLYGAPNNDRWNDLCSAQTESHCYLRTIIEWSADCNSDGIVDYGQILNGQLADTNANNIPDCCEPGNNCCVGDIYVNHIVDGGDLGVLLSEWGVVTPTTNSDLNRDGFVNGADLGMLLANWGPCGG